MFEEEKKLILSLIDKNDLRVLDVGCGDGRYCDVFTNICCKYIGIDVDNKLIRENNNRNQYRNVFYECANIIKYRSEEKFDFIILSLAFHEIDIKEQGLALINMLKLLDKGGKIIILDPTLEKDSFQGLWNVAYDNLLFFNHDYTVKHSKRVIDQAVKNNLCRIIKYDKISLKFEFSSVRELVDMVLESSEFELIKYDDMVAEKLEGKLKEFLAKENDIVIYDKLDITVLEKVEE